jgi:fumarate hydratase subunit alpha
MRMKHKKRIISTEKIQNSLIDLLYDANFILEPGIIELFREMKTRETSPIGREAIEVLIQNSVIAREDEIPLCQDCGTVIIFLEIGQQVEIREDNLGTVINAGVEEAYRKFYLRKSIVRDPLKRINTGTNSPCVIHTEIVEGDSFRMTVYLKGGGSENMTSLKMFRPTETISTIIDHIMKTVVDAGPNPCPPLFLGIGIGGTSDLALLNSKKAVLHGIGRKHPDPFYRDLESEIMVRINSSNVGPLGFGGMNTVAGVYIKEAPAHIASLPVALNLNCHSLRFRSREL